MISYLFLINKMIYLIAIEIFLEINLSIVLGKNNLVMITIVSNSYFVQIKCSFVSYFNYCLFIFYNF